MDEPAAPTVLGGIEIMMELQGDEFHQLFSKA